MLVMQQSCVWNGVGFIPIAAVVPVSHSSAGSVALSALPVSCHSLTLAATSLDHCERWWHWQRKTAWKQKEKFTRKKLLRGLCLMHVSISFSWHEGRLNWLFHASVPFSLTPDLDCWHLPGIIPQMTVKTPDVASGCFMKSDMASIIINPHVPVMGWGRPHRIWFPAWKYFGLCRFSRKQAKDWSLGNRSWKKMNCLSLRKMPWLRKPSSAFLGFD